MLTGRVLCMPSGRGSSSSSYVFAESIRTGTAPAAVVLGEPDAIVALGAIVAAELYGIEIPVIVADLSTIAPGRGGIGADDAGRRLAAKRPD